ADGCFCRMENRDSNTLVNLGCLDDKGKKVYQPTVFQMGFQRTDVALMSRSDERVEQRMWSFFVVRANERSVSRTMGSGASTDAKGMIEGKSPEEIAAALKELPADQLQKIWACVDAKTPCPGPVDCSSITVVAKDYKGMLEQPSAPKYKGALAQIYVRSQPYGGSDKSNNGHRSLAKQFGFRFHQFKQLYRSVYIVLVD
ncbi:Bacl-2, partial [Durusdinium trenchii]